MWAVVLFFASLVLLILFVVLHAWETSHSIRFFKETRAVWDRRVLSVYRAAVSGDIPTEWRREVRVALHAITHSLVVFLVEALHAIERPLTKLSHRLRTHTPSGNGKEVSPFLKTLSPEKKNGGETTTDTL